MPFESEVIPLFIGGVYLVSLLELVIGCALLKGEKATREYWIGHVVSMTIAMVFLIRCIFGSRLGIDVTRAYGDASPWNSVNIGLFGMCWAISAGFLLAMIGSKTKKS